MVEKMGGKDRKEGFVGKEGSEETVETLLIVGEGKLGNGGGGLESPRPDQVVDIMGMDPKVRGVVEVDSGGGRCVTVVLLGRGGV